jgi:hypothetical protein
LCIATVKLSYRFTEYWKRELFPERETGAVTRQVERVSHDKESAEIAWPRSMDFFAQDPKQEMTRLART